VGVAGSLPVAKLAKVPNTAHSFPSQSLSPRIRGKAPSPLDAPLSKPGEPVIVQPSATAQRPPAPDMVAPPSRAASTSAALSSLSAELFNTDQQEPELSLSDTQSQDESDAGQSAEFVRDEDRELKRERARRDGLRHIALGNVMRMLNQVKRDQAALEHDQRTFDSFPAASSKELRVQINYTLLHTTRLDGQPITGYLAIVANPLSHFGILPAPGSRVSGANYRCTLHKTSETATTDGCLYATNAGFFNMQTGACLGHVVHDSQLLQVQYNGNANFGIDRDGNFISGYLTDEQVRSMGFVELISGRGWLVRNGESVLKESIVKENIDNRFVTIKAPRTAMGYDREGRLMILSVDGEEDIGAGADLHDFTKLLLDLGASNAVNLDGGGSGTVFYRGHIISKPTCDDTPRICERPVTTIVCVY